MSLRQMAKSLPLIVGLLFDIIQSLNFGLKSNISPYRNLAVRPSWPVTLFMKSSSKYLPSAISEDLTNLAPLSLATSFLGPPSNFLSMKVEGSASFAYSPSNVMIMFRKVVFPFWPRPWRKNRTCSRSSEVML